ncbi:hypothetical protein JXQ31_05425 [candidate division KSB1 bacterium]|nr:hypothetical protein [candidate division KSB1 bacterium]
MNPVVKIAKHLDRKEYFSFRLWEFCLRNTVRLFPWYFLFAVLIRHPLTALHGFWYYRNLVRNSPRQALHGTINLSSLIRTLRQNKKNGRLILAPGFCMKPFDAVKRESICPAGFFNHRCAILDQPELLRQEQETWAEPCDRCNIGRLARLSAQIHADFYIMTSALDIAHDLFLPSLQGTGANMGIFLLCPYSAEAFTFGLTVTGMKGALITFCKGDCQNYEEFTRADIGIKKKQTFIEESDFEYLQNELAADTGPAMSPSHRIPSYSRKNNVYRAE